MRQKGLIPILIALLVAAVLGGYLLYQAQARTLSKQAPTATPTSSLQPSNQPAPSSKVNPQSDVINFAKEDLAKRLGIDRIQIDIVSVEEIQWTNSSLGCPEPGKMYTQAIVPGYKVIFEYQGKQYEYHTGGGMNRFVTC